LFRRDNIRIAARNLFNGTLNEFTVPLQLRSRIANACTVEIEKLEPVSNQAIQN